MCLWNIHGAAISKLETHEHMLDLFQHVDVVALTETHHFPSDTFSVLSGFCCFDVVMPVITQGVIRKHSGGIAVPVRETWANSTGKNLHLFTLLKNLQVVDILFMCIPDYCIYRKMPLIII
jgi:hypothetical protein